MSNGERPLKVFMVSRDSRLLDLWADPNVPLPSNLTREPLLLTNKLTAESRLRKEPADLLLVNFKLPQNAQESEDESGETALELLKTLKKTHGKPTPAIVFLPDKHEMSESIDEELSADLKAIGLPSSLLFPFFAPFWDMIRDERPSLDTVEIEISDTHVKTYLGWQGRRYDWRQRKLPKGTMDYLKKSIAGFDALTRPGRWLDDLKKMGSELFRDLVVKSVGEGVFSHLEATCGLSGLAFRFKIDKEEYFSLPVEASVRWVQESHTFILRESPLARRIEVGPVRRLPSSPWIARSAKLLFIKSQVAENTKGDRIQISYMAPDGKLVERTRMVRKLDNIEREWDNLKQLGLPVEPKSLDLSVKKPAAQALRDELSNGYDIVHFAGHSITEDIDGFTKRTWLILPGDRQGEAVALPIDEFAKLTGQAGVRLVYLSSCQGSSPRTVRELVSQGVPYSIGFRWDVHDTDAPVLAHAFYKALFDKSPTTIGSAFRTACSRTSQELNEAVSPIWASPILIAQADDWAVNIAA